MVIARWPRGEGEWCWPRFSSFCQLPQNKLVKKDTDPPGPTHKRSPQPHLPSGFHENRWKSVIIGLSEWKWGSPPKSGESQPPENTITKATGGVCCKPALPASGIQELLQTAGKRGLQTHLTLKHSQPQEKDRPGAKMSRSAAIPQNAAIGGRHYSVGRSWPSLNSFPGGSLTSEPREGRRSP